LLTAWRKKTEPTVHETKSAHIFKFHSTCNAKSRTEKKKKKKKKKKDLVPFPLSFLRAKLSNMVFGFANKTALTRLHPRDSKWVFIKPLSNWFAWVIGCFGFCLFALELALRFLLLPVWVFGGRWLWLREQFRVCFFVPLAS
jgi:hypothetical protein